MSIQIKRVYESPSKSDGFRILVDRLWPRGVKKETAQIDLWLKDVAPSTALRKWFNHEPAKWKGFTEKYNLELKGTAALKQLRSLLAQQKEVTLVYAAKDEAHNQAVALQHILKHQ